jgi:hypothetical protein
MAARDHDPPKDRQSTQQCPLGVIQERVAPVERRPQRLLTRVGGAATARQQGQTIVEAFLDLGGRQHADARRGELDRQRHAVESVAHPADRMLRARIEVEGPLDGPRAFDEEIDCFERGERRHPPAHVAGDTQRLTACRQHGQVGTSTQQQIYQ